MFSQLLVPLDGTSESEVALEPACALARSSGAEIVLLRVMPGSASHAEETEAVGHLEWTAAELRTRDVAVGTEVRRGDPAEQIVDAACLGPRLVVMATHGRAGLGRVLFGSVAERVVAHSPVPVLLRRPGGRRLTVFETLLVPVDGTDADWDALGAALVLARATGARIFLLHVVLPLRLYAPSADPFLGLSATPYVEREWDETAQRGAQEYVEGLADVANRGGVKAEATAIPGPVVETIVDAAEWTHADLIVMSTHGRTGASRALHGSVADAVMRAVDRGVLMIGNTNAGATTRVETRQGEKAR
jgi:nucleotide-binding universal stress UspA family protein